MRARIRQLVYIVAAATVLPLATDAAIPVPPASKTPACFQPDAPFTRRDGDEKFFSIPGGVPNVMLVLDNSGSMLDLPTDIPYPSSWPATGGTCTTSWDSYSAKLTNPASTPPYDNGYAGLVSDNPAWGYGQCAAFANPTTNGASDRCLFRGGGTGGVAYYKAYGQSGRWSWTSATVYNANPCAIINSGGTVQSTALPAATLNECNNCLATKGYYLFRPSAVISGVNWGNQAVFRGDFLNVNPPKYAIARKVVKDLARIDAANASPLDQVRLGLSIFTDGGSSGTSSGLRSGDGGILVVPLGPNCDDAVPATQAGYAPARQAIVNAVNNNISWGGMTPLAETLFNVGQYFGSTSLYSGLFGASWVRSTFGETAAGTITAPWVSALGKRQASVCWGCQQSSVVVVTDGEPTNDSNLPRYPTPSSHTTFDNDFRSWTNPTIACPSCGTHTLHKVAYFLNQTDVRPDKDGTQRVSTYTISFGLNATTDAAALALLQKTADLGGGQFKNTSSGAELATALNEAVTDVVQKSTSFSAANASSLQTSRTNQADAYVARFKPSDSPAWEGHLFASMLFDEFGQGCDARKTDMAQTPVKCGTKTGVDPNLNGDVDASGNAVCTSAYLVDRDCDPIIEDANGNYKKGTFVSGGDLLSTPDDANMFWDAGKVLSDPSEAGYRSADETATNARKIYTTIDVNGDGKLTAADGLVEFTSANAAGLAPFLGLDRDSCISLLQSAGFCGATPMPACPTTATYTTANQTTCAQVVINFVRGWDVLDWDGDRCYGPGAWPNTNPWGSCTTAASCGAAAQAKGVQCVSTRCVYPAGTCNGEQRDRIADHRPTTGQSFWKLGDIFHSSPVVVKRPIDKLTCAMGMSTQCVRTIFSNIEPEGIRTPIADYGGLDAYDMWRSQLGSRTQFILVGSNDGMLHAFHAGDVDTSQPRGFDGMYPYNNGTGTELWAYIPPDLLPKLKGSLDSHQYFVDGTTMVRDVWVDFSADGIKQRDEFRTVAVIAERAGGSRYSALDVTDPLNPQFLWTFPDGCTEDSILAGESWAEFLPRPPPIVPVRLRATGADPAGRGFDERWVVLLNGGYDPGMVRGRAVWMLDVWSGKKLWQYTDADFKAMRGDAKASMFPVAATIGASDAGRCDAPEGGASQVDGMFDTATWGDTGGNIFLARFYEPGVIGANGLVSNWTAARAFEEARQTDDLQRTSGRTSYFHMTANVLHEPDALRVLVGSGNRARLMDPRPTCGPDDALGCARAGCAASSTCATSYGAASCAASGTFSASGGVLSYSSSAAGCGGSFAAPGPASRQSTLNATCGSETITGLTAARACDASGLCAPAPTYKDVPFGSGNFTPSSLPAPTDSVARFVSLWAYGRSDPKKRFTTPAEARVFEDNRFTDRTYPGGCSNWPDGCGLTEVANALVKLDARGNFSPQCQDGALKCSTTMRDPGWMFTYGKWCVNGPGKCSSPTPWYDEQTATQPSGHANCVIWSGFRPTGASATSDPCSSSVGSPSSAIYFSDFYTGIPTIDSSGSGNVCGIPNSPDLRAATEIFRSAGKNAFSAPQTAQARTSINPKGEISQSVLVMDSGSSPQKFQIGSRPSAVQPLYWLEVPREVHTCRHVNSSACK